MLAYNQHFSIVPYDTLQLNINNEFVEVLSRSPMKFAGQTVIRRSLSFGWAISFLQEGFAKNSFHASRLLQSYLMDYLRTFFILLKFSRNSIQQMENWMEENLISGAFLSQLEMKLKYLAEYFEHFASFSVHFNKLTLPCS